MDERVVRLGFPMDEHVVRLGVTGLSRAGKTVFITSLVASLKHRENMLELGAAHEGRIQSVRIQDLPEAMIPRFPFEDHLPALMPPDPAWPPGTTRVNGLRVTLQVNVPKPLHLRVLGGRDTYQKTVHLDIIDFPGEWLIDLTLMNKDFEQWSIEHLEKIAFETLRKRPEAIAYLELLQTIDTEGEIQEQVAKSLVKAFTAYLKALQKDGYSNCTPGRFLLPGDLEDAPVLSFTPLYPRHGTEEGSLYKEFQERFTSYKYQIVRKDFFEKYLKEIDRQVVLVDVMAGIHDGPAPFEDQRKAMENILSVFKPGRNNKFLAWLGESNNVEKMLFAATKADHLHHSNHGRLKSYIEEVIQGALTRAEGARADTQAMVIAALRVTTEGTAKGKGGKSLCCVRGRLELGEPDDSHQGIPGQGFYPGDLPDINRLLAVARKGAKGAMQWPQTMNLNFRKFKFLPDSELFDKGPAPPHLYLDQALEFLIGDLLR